MYFRLRIPAAKRLAGRTAGIPRTNPPQMKLNNITSSYIFRICALVGVLVLAFIFPSIIFYLFLSYIFTLLCEPVVKVIEKIRVFKRQIPRAVSSGLAIIFYLLVFSLALFFFVPTLINEVRAVENINYEKLSGNLNFLLRDVETFLRGKGFLDKGNTLVGLITEEMKQLISINSFSGVLGNVASFTGSFFVGTFTVLFVTYFFLKDDFRLDKIMGVFFSENYTCKLREVADKINNLLSRYFVGTLVRLAIMVVMTYAGLAMFGIKGALFLGFLGGVLNIIPYLGPVIGCVIACIFGIVDGVTAETYSSIMPNLIKIIGVFVASNAIDNFVLQPVIFSQSVKAHPVEIFLVTIMGGSVGGITGMILAIPVYTIIRVVVIEIYLYANDNKPPVRDDRPCG